MTVGRTILDVVVGLWTAIGPLVGVFLGAYIANKNQRKHWIADNKKHEYRELLSVLARTSLHISAFYTPPITRPRPEQELAYDEVGKKTAEVILDRIFIAQDIEKLNLLNRWRKAIRDVEKTKDASAFAEQVHAILSDIREAAWKMTD